MVDRLILLTGATGYVGGRLLQHLETAGHRLRCLARRPGHLEARVAPGTEVVAGDVRDRASLDAALRGVTTAFYLVHSMGTAGSFEEEDREAARRFGEAAKAAGVARIIYLGGLGADDEALSPHLRSRQEVGELLRGSGVPVVEFRASIVIGSGSLSFELIRSLVERLPIMILPKWVSIPAQPIAIADVIAYLTAAIDLPITGNPIFEIGGADRVSYGDIMRAYARRRGLHVPMIPVPVLTPFLSSLWLGLVTPVYARIGRKLVESIVHSTVVRDDTALRTFPIRPMGMEAALTQALANEDREWATTRWSDAMSSSGPMRNWDRVQFGRRLADSRTAEVRAAPPEAFAAIERIGGDTGWYAYDWLWRLRGVIDLLLGGVGSRRGRPGRPLRVGDTIDFWRVEAFEPNRLLRLAAEMKLPGRAWLEFEVQGDAVSSTIRQTAIFDPIGWLGRLYWYALIPLHLLIFRDMLRAIAAAATRPRSLVGGAGLRV